jgi:predicted amidohydrolase YtcJ
MKDFAAKTDAEWVLGGNLHIENLAEGRFPYSRELDAVGPRPMLLFSYCLHVEIANSEALKRGGIVKGFKPEIEGLVEFYEDGEPNGIIRENTYGQYLSKQVEGNVATKEGRKALLKKYLKDYSMRGITSIQTFSALADDPLEYIDQYMELDREGALPIRITVNSSGPLDYAYHTVSGFGDDKIRIGAKKLFCDGSLNARAAALRAPYSDAPGETGITVHSQESLNAQAREAYEQGYDVAMHTIGDRGMDFVLNAIEYVLAANGYDDAGVAAGGPLDEEPDGFRAAAARKYKGQRQRFRIIHAQLIDPSQLDRIARLPVVLDLQPSFVRNWHAIAKDRIGLERAKYLFPFNTYRKRGFLTTASSDAPVEPAYPLMAIQVAVTRQTLEGIPEGGFFPDERLPVFDAVAMYTRNAAYCGHEEDRKGSLTEGRLADFIVLGDDIFEIDPHGIAETRVEQVYLSGERVV